jgi:hypothetical protein
VALVSGGAAVDSRVQLAGTATVTPPGMDATVYRFPSLPTMP